MPCNLDKAGRGLTSLRERVEAATGPSRELDWAIWGELQGVHVTPTGEFWGKLEHPFWEIGDWHGTSSLDAALALVERVLPGCVWQLGFDPDDGSMCARIVTEAPPCAHVKANHQTAPLAVCAALLMALEAQGG